MTKLFGAAAVMLASIFAAYSKTRADREVIEILHSLVSSLRFIRGELAERMTPLGEIFAELESCDNAAVRTFYVSLSKALPLAGEQGFKQIWTQTAEKNLAMLGDRALRVLQTCGDAFERSDVKELISQLAGCACALEEYEKALLSAQGERTRLSYGVALSLGAFVLILLI